VVVRRPPYLNGESATRAPTASFHLQISGQLKYPPPLEHPALYSKTDEFELTPAPILLTAGSLAFSGGDSVTAELAFMSLAAVY